jgi:hypothetical protein
MQNAECRMKPHRLKTIENWSLKIGHLLFKQNQCDAADVL